MPSERVNILLFLAQGFEDLEAVAVLDVFGWTQYRGEIGKASVTTAAFHDLLRGRFGMQIGPDIPYSEIDSKKYHALVLPGGFHSHGYDEAVPVKSLRLLPTRTILSRCREKCAASSSKPLSGLTGPFVSKSSTQTLPPFEPMPPPP